MAATAITSLTSCSDDEPNGGGSGGGNLFSKRKLVSIRRDNNIYGYSTYLFYKPIWDGDILKSYIDGGINTEDYGYTPEDDRMSIEYIEKNKAILCASPTARPREYILNDNGYAIIGRDGEYTYTYNDYGQMTGWTCEDEDYPEKGKIYYNADGDMIATSNREGSSRFEYTNNEVTTPIENVGNVMLFSEWNVMYDYEYFYWFGIYGRASKHLPVKMDSYTMSWTLDSRKYPTKCVLKNSSGKALYTFTFEWE